MLVMIIGKVMNGIWSLNLGAVELNVDLEDSKSLILYVEV